MADVLIETFELGQTGDPTQELEDAEEIKALADELGLKGQKKIFTEEDVIPFLRLSKADKRIWFTFCPGKHDVEDYEDTVIPLRVLGIIKVCQEREYFDDIFIRTESTNSPDPIVVGKKGEAWYLIARWGHALTEWKEIVEAARIKARRAFTAYYQGVIAEAKGNLDSIDGKVDQYMNGDWMSGIYSIHGLTD